MKEYQGREEQRRGVKMGEDEEGSVRKGREKEVRTGEEEMKNALVSRLC